MNGETLFRALSDVGDDLLELAQTKSFVNPWRRWAKTAACLALVLCLTALVLPSFPRGCGSAKDQSQIPEAAEDVQSPSASPEETNADTAVPEEGSGEYGSGEKQEAADAAEPVTFRFEEQTYALESGPLEAPVTVGEDLGTPESWNGRDLSGCRLYSSEEPDMLYVETPEGIYQAFAVQ